MPSWSIAPYFFVPDVITAANWYRDALGFSYDRFWGVPAGFCMVRRSGITIMLSRTDEPGTVRPNNVVAAHDGPWDAYIWIDDADALHAEFVGRGVPIAREICDQEYGCRDFDVVDLNGYRLCFGHDLNA